MNVERIVIHDLSQDGRGVGRLESGCVIMVPNCYPGDEISAEVQESSTLKGALSGTLQEVLVSSPHRSSHPCERYSQGCSGSILGALSYEFTTEWKSKHLAETLRRIGGLKSPKIEPIISSEQHWNYRDRLELQLISDESGWKPAFQGHEHPVPVNSCSLGMPAINKALQSIKTSFSDSDQELIQAFKPRLLLRDNGHNGAVAILFLFGKTDQKVNPRFREWLRGIELTGWQIRLAKTAELRFAKSVVALKGGNPSIYIKTSLGEITAEPTVFTQVNRSMSEVLIRTALDHIPDGGSILDLYGGYGAFGLEYAIRGGNAEVIDSAGDSIAAGQSFCKAHNLPVVYTTLDLNKNPFLISMKGHPDACIADPPRTGINPKMRQWLQVKGPKRLIYVSCHPAALARDIMALSNYKAAKFYPLDMFPHTQDTETVAILDKKG